MEAGSIVVRINGDTTNLNQALSDMNNRLKESEKANQSMGAQFLKSQIIFKGLEIAARAVVDVVKKSIEAFKNTEIVEARARAVLGDNIEKYKQLASEIQRTTTVEDEAVLSTITYAKTLGVASNNLEKVTNDSIGLSKAFNIDLNQSVKMMTLAYQGNTEMLQKHIPELRTVKTESERIAIINRAVANGWKIADQEANTFTGQLAQLNNIQGDIFEETGRIAAAVGIDYVKAFKNAAQATSDWLSDSRNQSTIINSLKLGLSGITGILKPFIDGFKDLSGEVKIGNATFDVFKIAVQGVATAFLVIGRAVQLNFEVMFGFIKTIKLAGLAASNFWLLLTGNKEQKASAKKALAEIGDDYKTLGLRFVDLTKETVKGVQDIWAGATTNIKTPAIGGGGGGTTETKGSTPESGGKISIQLDVQGFQNSSNEIVNIMGGMTNNMAASVGNIGTAFKNVSDVMKDKTADWTQKAVAVGSVISSVAGAIGSAFTDAMAIAGAAVKNFFDNQLADMQAAHDSEIEMIDNKLALELELIENDGMTKAQKRDEDLMSLQQQLLGETDVTKKAALQKQIAELEKEKKIEEAKKKADKEKAMSDFKMAKAKFDMDKQQFEANKAMQAVQAGMAFAMGLIQLWSSVWQMGPIAGAILGGVMTGVLTGIFAANLAMILSSTFPGRAPDAPSFASGGFAPDNTIANVRRGELIANEEQQMRMLELLSGGSGQTINLIMDGSIIKTWQINNQRREALYS